MNTSRISVFLFSLSFFLCWMATTSAQNPAQLDLDYGFAGYKLASPDDSIRSLVKNGKQDHLQIMRPANPDSLYLNKIQLKKLKLYYFHGHLHSIDVITEEPQTDHLLAWIENRYGEGEATDMFGNEKSWYGEMTKLTYQKNPIMGTGTFVFTSKKMHVKYVTYMYDITYGDKADK